MRKDTKPMTLDEAAGDPAGLLECLLTHIYDSYEAIARWHGADPDDLLDRLHGQFELTEDPNAPGGARVCRRILNNQSQLIALMDMTVYARRCAAKGAESDVDIILTYADGRMHFAAREVRDADRKRPQSQALDVTPADILSMLTPNTERLEQLYDAIAHLPPLHMKIVRRHFFFGMSRVKIAQDLGISRKRVATLLSESLDTLRSFFDDER